MGQNLFRVRRRFDGQGISGIANFLAPEGLLVNYNPADPATVGSTRTLTPANGIKGFALMRAIVQSIPLDNFVFPRSVIKNQDVIGGAVTASKILEAEYEGPGLVAYSGTGAIDGTTAVGTALGINAGQLRVKQTNDEIAGVVRGQITPLDNTNPARILVEFI